jgi:hypothetical protein
MGTAAVDNYLTRLLLGPSAFFLPLRGINASHALAASRVLARFAAVIPLEDLGGAGARLLQQKVGWRGCPRRTNAHSGAAGGANAGGGKAGGGRRRLAQRQALGARSLHTLRELNRFDIGLHEQARRELRGRAAAGLAPDCSAPPAATGHRVRELGCV